MPNIKKTSKLFLWLLVLGTLWMSCISREEGCLDIQADNFDLHAERGCQDCCTYPSMTLTLTQKWGDRNFSTADTLYDLNQLPYKIVDLKYLLSGWTWTSDDGSSYTVDSLHVSCDPGQDFSFTPDILLIDSKQFVYTLGDVRKAVGIRQLHMIWGSQVDYTCLDPDDPQTPVHVTGESPLWDASSGMIHTLRLVVQKDLQVETFDTLLIPWTTDIPIGIPDLSLEMISGQNTNLRLTADYQQWWQDARTDDLSTFLSSVATHVSFTKTP